MIAIIGYGSLIWELGELAPHVAGGWRLGAGPRLPLEFSRISAKRLGALALCIDPLQGAPCATHVIASAREHFPAARRDLAARERAPEVAMGSVCLATGEMQSRLDGMGGLIAEWCRAEGWSGAVWTELEPNFAALRGEAFSLPAAIAYLAALAAPARDEAIRYITLAPAASDTPLRRALASLAWWQAEVARLGL